MVKDLISCNVVNCCFSNRFHVFAKILNRHWFHKWLFGYGIDPVFQQLRD